MFTTTGGMGKECAMTQMEQPPLDDKGKRKGYIRIIKKLWDAKGYNELVFSSLPRDPELDEDSENARSLPYQG